MPEAAVHVRIEGRVQGVWYRGWTVDTATKLGLSGWVRNRQDGSVEAVFAGEQIQIDEMIEKCRFGPRAAQVDQIKVDPETANVEPGFKQLLTA